MTNINGCRILAVIPAYNEENSVATVVRKALKFLPVLVVDDGSMDKTSQLASLAGAEVLSQQPNQGKGEALRMGFVHALALGYDAVLTLDADEQHDPDEIPTFLKAYEVGRADLIIGQRDFSKMPWVRRLSNTLGTRIFSWAVSQAIPDNQCGFRLISRRLLANLLEQAEPGFEFEVEMIVHCMVHKLKMEWVPIRTIYGDEKSHINPIRHSYKFIQVSLRGRHILRAAHRKKLSEPVNL
jgi:glycosyltransferase involved in cell wall biosynthesis